MSADLKTSIAQMIAECVIDNRAIGDIAECIIEKLGAHKAGGDLAMLCRESESDTAAIGLVTAALVRARRDGEHHMMRSILATTLSSEMAERDKMAVRAACFRVDPTAVWSVYDKLAEASPADA